MSDGIPGPAPREKRVHMAKLIRSDGAVVALCVFPALRVIDLRRSTWTNRPWAVTCRRCRAKLAAYSGPTTKEDRDA